MLHPGLAMCSHSLMIIPSGFGSKSKSEAFKAFVGWLTYVEKETGLKPCMICTDNRGEYLSKLWNNFLKECYNLSFLFSFF